MVQKFVIVQLFDGYDISEGQLLTIYKRFFEKLFEEMMRELNRMIGYSDELRSSEEFIETTKSS